MRLLMACLLVLVTTTFSRAADTELEKLLPEDTDFVVIVDSNKLLNSAALKTHMPDLVGRYGYEGLLAATADSPGSQKALKAKSVEIKKLLSDRAEIQKLMGTLGEMVTRVTLAGSVGGGGEPGLIIVEGKWEKDYVEGFLTMMVLFAPEDASVTLKNGRKTFQINSGPGQQMYIAVPSSGLLLMAMQESELTAALDRATGKSKPAARPGIRTMVREIDPENAITILADIGEQGIKVTGGAKVKTDVQFKLVIDAGNADMAMLLEDASGELIDQMRDSLADQAGNMPALKVLLDATKRLKKSRKGQLLTFELTLTEKEVDTMVKSALKPDID